MLVDMMSQTFCVWTRPSSRVKDVRKTPCNRDERVLPHVQPTYCTGKRRDFLGIFSLKILKKVSLGCRKKSDRCILLFKRNRIPAYDSISSKLLAR